MERVIALLIYVVLSGLYQGCGATDGDCETMYENTDDCCKCSTDYVHWNGTCVTACTNETHESVNNVTEPECNRSPANYSWASKTCKPCESGSYRHSTGDHSECLENCPGDPIGTYIDHRTGICEPCHETYSLCSQCDADKDSRSIENSKCEKLCGDQVPINRGGYPILCDKCLESNVLLEICHCCVEVCPDEYINKSGVCVAKHKNTKKSPCKPIVCIVLPIIVAFVVVVVIVLIVIVVCCRKRMKPGSDCKPVPLPSKHQLDHQEKSPLNRTTTPDGSPHPILDNHVRVAQPPTPPPMRNSLEDDSEQVIYENEEGNPQYIAALPSPGSHDAQTPSSPDYENKEVLDDIQKNKDRLQSLRGTPVSSRTHLHQNVPAIPDIEEDKPKGHQTPHNAKGYINQDVIEAHNRDMALHLGNANPNFPKQQGHIDSGAYDNSQYPQELYENVNNTQNATTTKFLKPHSSESNRQPNNDDDCQEDYMPMSGNLRRPSPKAIKTTPQSNEKPTIHIKPIMKPKPSVGTKPVISDDSQELYLDMGKNSREGSARYRGIMGREVPAAPIEPQLSKPDYYNQMDHQDEYYNMS